MQPRHALASILVVVAPLGVVPACGGGEGPAPVVATAPPSTAPTPAEPPLSASGASTIPTVASPTAITPAPTPTPAPQPAALPKTADAGRKLTKAEELALQADQMQLAILGSGGGRPATSSARPDIPPVDLSGASATTPPKPVGPKAEVHVGGVTATVPVANVDRVVAGLRARFRQCYQRGLDSDPSMSGKLVVVAKIGPNGEVSSAAMTSNSGLSEATVACVVRVLKPVQFDAPGGGGSTLSLPLTFVSSK